MILGLAAIGAIAFGLYMKSGTPGSTQKTPTETASAKAAKKPTAKLTVEVTWKYNNFVGNKPDTNAAVYLIPTNTKLSLIVEIQNVYICGDKVARDLSQHGAFVTSVSGTGKAKIQKIPAGKYDLIIISANTNEVINDDLQRNSQNILSTHFSAETETARISLRLAQYKNISEQPVTIEDGDDLELSKDFGLTAY